LDPTSTGKNSNKKYPKPWIFLIGTIVWTWTFYSISFITEQKPFQFPIVIFFAIGGLGPLIVSSILVSKGYGNNSDSASEFLKDSLDPRKLSLRWYLILTAMVLILVISPLLFDISTVAEEGLIARGPVLFLSIGAIFGGLEEIGWRGYAQDSLQRRFSVLGASLIIGVFWALWHLPLFFMEGTYQAGLGVGTSAFWAFNTAIIVSSPIYAWLYNRSGKITFAAVFYHATSNVMRELIIDVDVVFSVGVEAFIAILLIIVFWRMMGQKKEL